MTTHSLTPEQEQVVQHPLGQHARVLAVAGSGKSTTMTHRIKHLVQDCNIRTSAIQVLMFNSLARKQFNAHLSKAGLPETRQLKEILQERKTRLNETLAKLQREQADIASHLQATIITDERIADIEAFCSKLRHNLGNANFEQKRQIIDMIDLRGKLSIENEEKVVYVNCILGKQQLPVARTSPSSSSRKGNSVELTARFVLKEKSFYADKLLSDNSGKPTV